ncbi:MAG TPA: dihydrolipoyllysine-residue succinyltransferase [Verrucomicrobiae bacterium]|nr:dihydrolipoyllysine-residue succinyltransferase [Verrucomicrobiae bacterium]
MAIELKVPELGESITEVEIGDWLKKPGDLVAKDDPLVTLESEKATVELPSPEAGRITKVLKQKGEVAKVGEVIAYLDKDGQPESKSASPAKKDKTPESKPPAPAPAQTSAAAPSSEPKKTNLPTSRPASPATPQEPAISESRRESPQPRSVREQEVVPMSRLRRTVAERLVEAHRNAALLTTFNEIDMAQVMALRKQHGEVFQAKHHVKLGFMSFFVKACVDALKQFPVINAEVRGTDVVYHNFFDIGVAIGSGKGLVVPVLRNAERMSFAEIEKAIGDFATRARDGKLKPDELHGGTFTITNGGVYGSLLSTPIVNPPQSGVLGMHAIQERPVAREGNVVIRPMMYVALTYDHRIVDGREAVSFLKRVKDSIENPARMLIEA